MKKILLSSVLFLMNQLVVAQPSNLKVGDKITNLTFTDYIQNVPKDKNFTNKYKVLEFWATWCGPCLAAVPHINDLKTHYKDQNELVFLSLTDEKPEKVKKTLAKVPFKTVVVADQKKKTHQEFIMDKNGSYSIPRTFLIDNQNVVRWIGGPERLSPELIDKFLKGENLEEKVTPSAPKKEEAPKDAALEKVKTYVKSIYEIYNDEGNQFAIALTESAPVKMMAASYYDIENGKIMLFKTSIKGILAMLNKSPEYKIILSEGVSNNSYDFMYKDLRLQDKGDPNYDLMKNFLLDRLQLKESKEVRETEVYVLKAIDEKKLKSNENTGPEGGHYGTSAEYITIQNQKMKTISTILSENFGIIILPDEKLDKRYDFVLKKGDLSSLLRELNEDGLTLEKKKQNVEFLVYHK